MTGFLFSEDASHLVLIEKLNPAWQKGYFNGIGGKIECGEQAIEAMVREFKEETGVYLPKEHWTCFAKIYRPNVYHVEMFFAFSNLAFEARTVEKEQVVVIDLAELPAKLIPNLKWLIPLALDKQADFSKPIEIQEIAEDRTQA